MQVEQIVDRYTANLQSSFNQLVNIHTWFLDILNNEGRHLLRAEANTQQVQVMLDLVKTEY
jgi:hypothetical protein